MATEPSQSNPLAAFGANDWLVDEMYEKYLQDPNSVDKAWWDFFKGYTPGGKDSRAGTTAQATQQTQTQPAPAQPAQPAQPVQPTQSAQPTRPAPMTVS